MALNYKEITTFIGKLIITQRFEEEADHKNLYNSRPVYWKCPVEITSTDLNSAKALLETHPMMREFPSTLYFHNLDIDYKVIKKYYIDYTHGLTKLISTQKIGKKEMENA